MRYCNRDNCKLSHGTYLYHKHQILQNTHVKITEKQRMPFRSWVTLS